MITVWIATPIMLALVESVQAGTVYLVIDQLTADTNCSKIRASNEVRMEMPEERRTNVNANGPAAVIGIASKNNFPYKR